MRLAIICCDLQWWGLFKTSQHVLQDTDRPGHERAHAWWKERESGKSGCVTRCCAMRGLLEPRFGSTTTCYGQTSQLFMNWHMHHVRICINKQMCQHTVYTFSCIIIRILTRPWSKIWQITASKNSLMSTSANSSATAATPCRASLAFSWGQGVQLQVQLWAKCSTLFCHVLPYPRAKEGPHDLGRYWLSPRPCPEPFPPLGPWISPGSFQQSVPKHVILFLELRPRHQKKKTCQHMMVLLMDVFFARITLNKHMRHHLAGDVLIILDIRTSSRGLSWEICFIPKSQNLTICQFWANLQIGSICNQISMNITWWI